MLRDANRRLQRNIQRQIGNWYSGDDVFAPLRINNPLQLDNQFHRPWYIKSANRGW